MCAGYATRLYPLTIEKPKSLLEVAGKPIIEHIIDKILEVKEVDRIFIVTNNKFFKNFLDWLESNKSDKIAVINDMTNSNEERLGAIGDVNFAIEKENIDDDLMVIAGDNLFRFNLDDPYKYFKKIKKSVIVLYDVRDIELAKMYGIVKVDKNNKIIDFKEKPANPKSTLASTGIYLYPRKTVNLIKQYAKDRVEHDKPGAFIEWFYKKQDIYGFITKKRWFDIGSLDQLKKANKFFGK